MKLKVMWRSDTPELLSRFRPGVKSETHGYHGCVAGPDVELTDSMIVSLILEHGRASIENGVLCFENDYD